MDTLVFAAEGVNESLKLLDFINLGVLAVLAVGLIKGWVVPRYVLDRVIADLEKREVELKELRNRVDTEVLPQLWKTTDLLAQFANRGLKNGGNGS